MSKTFALMSCERCGCHLPRGSTNYLVSITLMADFDGIIPESAGQYDKATLFKEIETKTRQELENEISQQLSFRLCNRCRDEFIRNPAGSSQREYQEPGSPH